MSFLDQMKLPDLINLSLILILASYSKGWTVKLQKHFNATLGDNLTIQCSFKYPGKFYTPNVKVYWKNAQKSSFDTRDQDKNAFVSHPNETYVLEKYRGKTNLTGNITNGDCSLMIQNITENEPNIYVRVVARGDQYSFKLDNVSISVSGAPQVPLEPDGNPTPATLEASTMLITQRDSTTNYTAIFVPVALLLIIIFVIGIVFCIKHKRSKSFTRQDSGYYANFRRPTSNQANSETYCKKQDKKLPEPKAIDEPVYLKTIDEPVYINMEAPPDQMDQSMDHADSVYANVDYSKK